MFRKVSNAERIEREFRTDRMRNQYIFYDLNVRAGDPEELRSFTAEIMQEVGFNPVLNELIKFEDAEMEDVLRGGRLKPVKNIVKGRKEFVAGEKYKFMWKFFAFIGFFSLLLYFVTNIFSLQLNKAALLILTGVFMPLSLIVYSIKEKITLSLWVKNIGIYNVEDEESDIRIILSADCSKKVKEALKKLEEDVSEVYNVLAGKYVRRKALRVDKMIKKRRGETSAVPLLRNIRSVEKEMDALDARFANGEISEKAYNDVREKLERKKDKYEILLDLLNIKE